MKKYEYENRTIIEFDDGSRVSLNHSKYIGILDLLVQQTMDIGHRLGNPYKIKDDYVELYYYNIKEQSLDTMLIDYDDWLKYNRCRFYKSSRGYVRCHYNGEKKHAHHLIMNFEYTDGKTVIDHINHNPLDNRKSNLRIVSQSINGRNKQTTGKSNKTGIVGICQRFENYFEVRGRYLDGTDYCIPFKTLEEAKIFNEKIRKENGYL